jgi:hypothetical protein
MKPLPWSHSLLSTFENCPKQLAEVKVYKRVKEKPIDQRDWGIRAHSAIEDACKGRPLEPEMTLYQPLVDLVLGWKRTKGAEVYLEQKLAINKDLQPCGFFADDVFGRCVLDVNYIMPGGEQAIFIDWKTGKRKPSDQLERAALIGFANYPNVQLIRTDFVWVKDGVRDPAHFARADIPRMWEKLLPLLKEYRKAFKDENFPPRESGLCKGWCPVESCQFWSKKK